MEQRITADPPVPIPARMAHLPVDPRGFPVPVIVLRDRTGRALFAANDQAIAARMFREDRCHICGTRLFRGRWFIGGPLSAFHPDGAFYDGGMHAECAHYALQVCPWLALTNYRRAVGAALIERQEQYVAPGMVLVDHTLNPGRPVLFVAVMATGQSLTTSDRRGDLTVVTPKRPYRTVEFWQHGRQLPECVGRALVREALEAAGAQGEAAA